MQERYPLFLSDGIVTMPDALFAMERAAVAHSIDLHIDHDRMLRNFGALWMLARCTVHFQKLPVAPVRLETVLRPPTAAVSCRDFTFYDGETPVGTAVQTWVLADAGTRSMLRLNGLEVLSKLPFALPPRTSLPPRVRLPEDMTAAATWQIVPEEIDANGHLNNVQYLRRSAPLVSAGANALNICFERECFAGEALTLLTAPGGYVCGKKADGSESFRLRLWREE